MSKVALWHIPVSHYSEKARWALDHKGIDHKRHAPLPPAHMAVALALTRGRSKTFPLLVLDGDVIADSTEIIAALERGHPDQPLYPADPGEREQALALEDFFDEDLGPYSRLIAFHELRRDPDGVAKFAATLLPERLAGIGPIREATGRAGKFFVQVRYRVSDDSAADHARSKVIAALDRVEAELDRGGGDYLVGDRFSVADLTAASLFGPVVAPAEGPPVPDPPEAFQEFRAPLAERPGYRWVQEIFKRHRQGARRP